MKWGPDEMDRLERAIVEGDRVQILRRGTEYILIPKQIEAAGPGDVLIATSPLGDDFRVPIEEIDQLTVIR